MDPQHSSLLVYIACIVNHSVCVQPGLVRIEAFNCEFPIHLGWRGRKAGGGGAETDVVTRVAARSNGFSCCWQLLVLTAIQKRKKNSGKGSGERGEGKGVSLSLYLYLGCFGFSLRWLCKRCGLRGVCVMHLSLAATCRAAILF